jgi:hypothetical protein
VSDKVRVEFYTNATGYEEWPSGGLIGNGTGRVPHDCTPSDIGQSCLLGESVTALPDTNHGADWAKAAYRSKTHTALYDNVSVLIRLLLVD